MLFHKKINSEIIVKPSSDEGDFLWWYNKKFLQQFASRVEEICKWRRWESDQKIPVMAEFAGCDSLSGEFCGLGFF